jgi:microcystin-dependent protein
MSCSNCYNGCTQITSDQCIKYTGIDVPVLGIKTGDSLSYVEQALIEFLVSTLDGSGIVITLNSTVYCQIVTKYLPTCGDITTPVLFEALVKAACDLQTQIDNINQSVSTLNTSVENIEAQYKVECLTGVTATSGTHDILQAVISTLCQVILDLDNYVLESEINQIISDYLSSNVPTSNVSEKMVPFVAVPYFGAISGNFDTSGAGIVGTIWEKIYLCNGQNQTPDLRGRALIGVTTGMGGTPMSSVVDPAVGGNPNYILNGTNGANFVTLDKNQMPLHSHPGSSINVELEEVPHTHNIQYSKYNERGTFDSPIGSVVGIKPNFIAYVPTATGITETALSGVTVKTQTVTIASEGGNGAHPNFQPGIGCYYIMYIPQ